VPKGFLPATGTLEHLAFPPGSAFAPGAVRIDSGVRPGDRISPWYDPMIAKVIVHGPTRATALAMLGEALAGCHVAGSVTNLAFLGALSRHQGFAAGDVDTGLIARDLDGLIASRPATSVEGAVAALASLGLLEARNPNDPWSALQGWRHWEAARHFVSLTQGDQRHDVTVTVLGADHYRVEGFAEPQELSAERTGKTRIAVQTAAGRAHLDLVRIGQRITLFNAGASHGFEVIDPLQEAAEADTGGDSVLAPMPGLVKLVAAVKGQKVSKGDALMVLEAMKMEHTLTAPRDGVVAEVLAVAGDQVTDGTVLLALEPEHA
jgi:3-methylcrotonyl-CoA carboxylase alpha subunit